MSDSDLVVSFQSERNLWYVRRGDATAVISAEDMMNEYHRWHRTGRGGEWRCNAEAFCRRRIELCERSIPPARRSTGD